MKKTNFGKKVLAVVAGIGLVGAGALGTGLVMSNHYNAELMNKSAVINGYAKQVSNLQKSVDKDKNVISELNAQITNMSETISKLREDNKEIFEEYGDLILQRNIEDVAEKYVESHFGEFPAVYNGTEYARDEMKIVDISEPKIYEQIDDKYYRVQYEVTVQYGDDLYEAKFAKYTVFVYVFDDLTVSEMTKPALM